MYTQTKYYNNIAIISVSGHFYVNDVKIFSQTIANQLSAGYKCFVIDLEEVDFLNSIGIKTLVLALREIRRHGGDLRIASAQKHVRYVLKLAGIDTMIKVYPSTIGATVSYFADLKLDRQPIYVYESCNNEKIGTTVK